MGDSVEKQLDSLLGSDEEAGPSTVLQNEQELHSINTNLDKGKMNPAKANEMQERRQQILEQQDAQQAQQAETFDKNASATEVKNKQTSEADISKEENIAEHGDSGSREDAGEIAENAGEDVAEKGAKDAGIGFMDVLGPAGLALGIGSSVLGIVKLIEGSVNKHREEAQAKAQIPLIARPTLDPVADSRPYSQTNV